MLTSQFSRRQLASSAAGLLVSLNLPDAAPAFAKSDQEQFAWELISPLGDLPPARWDHTLAVFDDQRTLIAFGGRDAVGATFADTWTYSRSENGWSRVNGEGPSARFGHAVAVDQPAGFMYLFGGQFGELFLNDLWRFSISRNTWELVSDGSGFAPTPRYGTSMAYTTDGELIVSHGFTFEGRFNDTWSWTVERGGWNDISPASESDRPLNRCLHEAVWSDADQAMILYGGCSSGYGPCPQGDLWTFNAESSTWNSVQFPQAPAPRMNPGLAFDRGRSQTILFGGLTEGGYDDALWTLASGENPVWHLADASQPVPAPRASHDMCVTGPNLYVFGGITDAGPTNDLWLARLGQG